MRITKLLISSLLFVLALSATVSPVSAANSLPRSVQDSIGKVLRRMTLQEVAGGYVKVESIRIRERGSERVIEIRASDELAYYPMRSESVEAFYDAVRRQLPENYRKYTLLIYSKGELIDRLVPQYYASRKRGASFRATVDKPLVSRISSLSQPTKGLAGRHIALWQSHGRYFDNNMALWRWQRSRLWESVEDMYTQSYVIPFLLPMLERAGATVLLPRERSMRREEIIIDNDKGVDKTTYREVGSWSRAGVGFAHLKSTYKSGHNPFKDGTSRQVTAKRGTSNLSRATWSAEVAVSGVYSVYVSYTTLDNSVPDAHYTVHASGGDREFRVNQRMGGAMWVCLGDFYFEAGESRVLVTLDNSSSASGVVTADGVKIGGGMGNIERSVDPSLRRSGITYESTTSGYPRFTEGARYWLQWSGFGEDVYGQKRGKDDYRDDYMSRPHWVNALMRGSEALNDEEDDDKSKTRKRDSDEEILDTTAGKRIPLDLAFAFHSDAGVRLNDDIIGTLGIYCTKDNDGEFEEGVSRLRSRDLTDIVMTQIVGDIRAQYEPNWTRRGMWDRSYYEARVGWCPTMLLELLSHQNFADMRYGLDPAFRFSVCRAIYKGMLRYLSSQYGVDYVVQPLPVNSFSVEMQGNAAHLSWQPTVDELESTATPDYYVVYTSVDGGGFDCGRRVEGTSVELAQESDKIYSYRVTAVNSGGESFDSETLAACRVSNARGCVMVVNGFDRVAAPYSVQGDSIAGFFNRYDSGVGYHSDISFIGEQVNFDRRLSRSENDNYALGQSYNDYEAECIAGNTFDYPVMHGASIVKAGYSFVSASRKAVESGAVSLDSYDVVDVIMGKQRTTVVGRGAVEHRHEVFTEELQRAIRSYTRAGGALILSGSYMLTDLWHSPLANDADRLFAEEVLHVTFGGNMSTRSGEVYTTPSYFAPRGRVDVNFNTALREDIYCVESPEVLRPAGKGAATVMRYASNNQTAAAAYSGDYRCVVLGFPFETILSAEERDELMSVMLKYVDK